MVVIYVATVVSTMTSTVINFYARDPDIKAFKTPATSYPLIFFLTGASMAVVYLFLFCLYNVTEGKKKR